MAGEGLCLVAESMRDNRDKECFADATAYYVRYIFTAATRTRCAT